MLIYPRLVLKYVMVAKCSVHQYTIFEALYLFNFFYICLPNKLKYTEGFKYP